MLSHSGAKVVLVEDAAAGGEDRHRARRAARARARRRADRRGRGRDHAGRPALARRRGRRRIVAERIAVDRPAGHGDDRLHLGHDRAAQGLRALAREPALHRGHLHRPPEAARQAPGDLPVPAAGARAGADGLLRHARDRRHAGLLGRRHEEPRGRHRRGQADATSRPSRGCWRRSTRASSAPPPPPAAPRPRSSRARWPRARRWPRPSARAARSARSTRPATRSATSSRSRRSATRSAPTTRC